MRSHRTRTRRAIGGMLAICVAAAALALAPATAGAATLRVDPGDPSAHGTIASALAAAAAGDNILVSPGRYPETVGLKSGVAIEAVPASAPAMLDGEGVRRALVAVGVSDATVTGFVITGGRGDPDGGAIASVGSTVTLLGCVIRGNTAAKGGAILAVPADGGVLGRMRVINCTIVGNSAQAGPAIFAVATPVGLANTITWGNGGSRATELVGPVRAAFSNVRLAGTGNLDADPRFVDAAAGDFRLVLGSFCVDTASTAGAPATDISGEARPQDGDGDGLAAVDMGAHERVAHSGGPTIIAIMSCTPRVAYGRSAVVTGMLRDRAGAVKGSTGVSVWSTSRLGGVMTRLATATWDARRGVYVATVRCVADRWIQFRFSGGGDRCASRSQVVRVRAGARLSAPAISGPAYRGGVFKVSGTLRPAERGSVRLYFYRKVGSTWRRYGPARSAKVEQRGSYTRYSLATRLPYAGSWRVRAYHADWNHLATWSVPRDFTVDLFPSGGFIFPIAGKHRFTDTWGAPRAGHTHQGTDVFADLGTPCVAVVAGNVMTKEGGSAGKSVWLTGKDGTKYFYAHLHGWAVRRGRVRAGQVVGYVGNTGNASGGSAHLHFGIQHRGAWINPYRTLLRAKKVRVPGKARTRKLARSVLSRPAIRPGTPHRARYFRIAGTLTPGARAWVRLSVYRRVGRKWVRLRTVRARATTVKGKWYARYDLRVRVSLPGRYTVRATCAIKGRAKGFSKVKFFQVR